MARERAVVVGAGGISGAWFPPLKSEGVDVVAVVDLNLEAAQRRIAEFSLDAEPSTDLAATLAAASPDFVVDLTVPEAHCEVTCMALEAGCHVIGEKPMASSMDEARRMVATAERTGKLYMVGQSRRWDATHAVVARTLAAGEIGALTSANCDFYIGAHFGGFRDEMDSPLILDMAIHHFDLVRFFTGADPVAVYALEFNPAGSWYRGDAAASCVFEMSDGLVFTFRGSWCAEGCHTSWNGDWRFIGDRGTLILEKDGTPWGERVAGDEGFHRPLESVTVAERVEAPAGQHGALVEMLRFLRTGEKPQTECHDNIKSLAMVFGATASSSRGGRVTIDA
ncbi:MAG: Gfo/Idh/MocA family oxidoreductase [Armatimonadetes bacterium]|jgi:predicted dehydrogenase|nr:Gfo/Idh/MocA family oxidoreductase [Armatimonadota bacterium]MDI9600618.1 Gfo/Idh/MocA family oxidoreductase [Acidobacteriota bacterium]